MSSLHNSLLNGGVYAPCSSATALIDGNFHGISTDTGWWHNAATCIHVDTLSRKYTKENGNGIALMIDPVTNFSRLAGGMAWAV